MRQWGELGIERRDDGRLYRIGERQPIPRNLYPPDELLPAIPELAPDPPPADVADDAGDDLPWR